VIEIPIEEINLSCPQMLSEKREEDRENPIPLAMAFSVEFCVPQGEQF
jgi:hypothetical protein